MGNSKENHKSVGTAAAETLEPVQEEKAVELLEQLFESYSVFRALMLEESLPPNEEGLSAQTIADCQCAIIDQTIETFQELRELDPRLMDNVVYSLSEHQYDCVSRFYADGRKVYKCRWYQGPNMGRFGGHDRAVFRQGLLKMQGNIGLMLYWLETGETYDNVKNQWPIPARQKQKLAEDNALRWPKYRID